MIKKTLIFAALTLRGIYKASAQVPDPNFHIYLLIGQSNMAGRARLDSVKEQPDVQILMLDQFNKWVTAADPVHFDKPSIAGVGPALSFAKSMIKNDRSIRIGLVPCASGGSPIIVWQPDSVFLSGHPYDDAVRRTRIALKAGVLKGILWHQGESDTSQKQKEDYLSAEGLTDIGDKIRFNTVSARTLGVRYAVAMMKLNERR